MGGEYAPYAPESDASFPSPICTGYGCSIQIAPTPGNVSPPPTIGVDCHFQTILRVACDGSQTVPPRSFPHSDRLILPSHRAGLQLCHQRVWAIRGLGNHHQPTGVFVQPVNNSCSGQGVDFRTLKKATRSAKCRYSYLPLGEQPCLPPY